LRGLEQIDKTFPPEATKESWLQKKFIKKPTSTGIKGSARRLTVDELFMGPEA